MKLFSSNFKDLSLSQSSQLRKIFLINFCFIAQVLSIQNEAKFIF